MTPFTLTNTSHPGFPLPSSALASASTSPLRVSVLDSSFNPPHLAHLALALAHPPPLPAATLLVLSTKNADKVPKPGEPSPEDRLEMMEAMAGELGRKGLASVGVARIEEPTFVGKSVVLKAGLEERAGSGTEVHLSFLLGESCP